MKAGKIDLYRDKTKGTAARAADLLARMTMEEKIGQMTQMCASSITLDGTKKLDLNEEKIADLIVNHHVGSLLSGTGTAARWKAFTTGIQKVAMTKTRLGIPIIFGIDHVHGAGYVDDATFLPHQLNLASTFNKDLVYKAGELTALEQMDLGMPWNFSPVVDLGRNPHWPRLYETFGEDPLVCGSLGGAMIRGFQSPVTSNGYRQAGCAKHFIGYSDPRSGYDRTPADISPQSLYEWHVPAFDSAIRAGVRTVMVNSGELNGRPLHADKAMLTGLLRQRLGFEGVLVTDIKDIQKLVSMHGAYATEKEATMSSILAGIDVYMACNSLEFQKNVMELISEGKLTPARIDSSVARILKLKFDLGLFDAPYGPTKPSPRRSKEALALALQSAEESLVLLRNDGILPLSSQTKRILIAGPGATSKRILNGPWTMEWLGAEDSRQPVEMLTVADALKKALPACQIEVLAWQPTDSVGCVNSFAQKVGGADHVILCLGEQPYSEFKGNTPTAYLQPLQQQMLSMAKSKPTTIIMLAGRPKLIKLPEQNCAFIWAGIPGMQGGLAIASLLTGKSQPTGRLPFTYPGTDAHLNNYFVKASDSYTPAFGFGAGLGYAKGLQINGISLQDTVLSKTGTCKGYLTLTNTGSISITEPILLFLQDPVGTITRPLRKLVYFSKVTVAAGETVSVPFVLQTRCFMFPDEAGKALFEEGMVRLMCGEASKQLMLKGD